MVATLTPPPGTQVAKVLLETRLPQLAHVFDYALPAELANKVKFGQRVKVPLRSGAQQVFGWIVGFATKSEYPGKLAQISAVIGDVPLLTPEIWELAGQLADRAAGSTCDILRLAIPGRHARAEKKFLTITAQADITDIAQARAAQLQARSAAAQKQPHEGINLIAELQDAKRLAYTASHGVVRLATGQWVGGWAKTLAVSAAEILGSGKSVIVCVPDWRDLEQATAAISAEITAVLELEPAEYMVRFDAKQSPEKRFYQFLQTLLGGPKIVIGNRSVVYAPVYQLGAIIMWDEADTLLAEPLAPYVHPRDAALQRQLNSGCGLLFMSHARSAEIQRLIEVKYVSESVIQPRRTKIRHAAMSANADEFAGRIPEIALRLIRQEADNGPVLVQVAKPGYASALVCQTCQLKASCMRCKGPLGAPQSADKLQCLWCLEQVINWRCADCGNKTWHLASAGTLLTAERLQQMFQGYRVLVADGDNVIERVDSRPAIVVATVGAEPLAAGGYSAVVLLDAERLLAIPTLRAAEDCLRWWENAAAKAGPQAVCMLASGAGAAVQAFLRGQSAAFLRQELSERAELRYPPAVRVAAVTGELQTLKNALRYIAEIAETEVLEPVQIEKETWRAVIRCSYRAAPQVAKILRAQIVAAAAGRFTPTRARPKPKSTQGLRVKFDDRSIFDEPLRY